MSLERTEIVRPSVRGNEERKATTVSLHGQRLPRLGFTMNVVDQARIQQADTVGPLEQHRDQQLPVALDQIGELHAAPRRIALWLCSRWTHCSCLLWPQQRHREPHQHRGDLQHHTNSRVARADIHTAVGAHDDPHRRQQYARSALSYAKTVLLAADASDEQRR